MSSHLLSSMDYDQNKSYMDPTYDTYSYMDSTLDFLQYPESSPPSLGISAGLPTGGSPMNYTTGLPDNYYPASSFGVQSPPRSYSPPELTASPPSMPYTLSGAEMSSDSLSGRASRGSRSPPAVPYSATVPRSHRFNPMAVPANRPARATHKRRASRANDDSDDDDEDFQPGPSTAANGESPARDNESRRETVRKQRIESEQRRRDELREGYARLKETLPASNQKASKVSLLDRATSHIKYLEAVKDQLEARLKGADTEVHRLRNVNEALMLNRATGTPATPQQAAAAAALVAAAAGQTYPH